jgi:hypothetical protein
MYISISVSHSVFVLRILFSLKDIQGLENRSFLLAL